MRNNRTGKLVNHARNNIYIGNICGSLGIHLAIVYCSARDIIIRVA